MEKSEPNIYHTFSMQSGVAGLLLVEDILFGQKVKPKCPEKFGDCFVQ